MSKDITEALRALTEKASASAVKQRPARGAAPRSVSAAGMPGGSSGAGIASPLTETAREYWPDQTVASTDGIFTLIVKPIKRVEFIDAAGNDAAMDFLEP